MKFPLVLSGADGTFAACCDQLCVRFGQRWAQSCCGGSLQELLRCPETFQGIRGAPTVLYFPFRTFPLCLSQGTSLAEWGDFAELMKHPRFLLCFVITRCLFPSDTTNVCRGPLWQVITDLNSQHQIQKVYEYWGKHLDKRWAVFVRVRQSAFFDVSFSRITSLLSISSLM